MSREKLLPSVRGNNTNLNRSCGICGIKSTESTEQFNPLRNAQSLKAFKLVLHWLSIAVT